MSRKDIKRSLQFQHEKVMEELARLERKGRKTRSKKPKPGTGISGGQARQYQISGPKD